MRFFMSSFVTVAIQQAQQLSRSLPWIGVTLGNARIVTSHFSRDLQEPPNRDTVKSDDQ